jgi:glucokinase
VTAHLGLDIGGTKTEAVVTDAGGLVLGQHRVDSGHGPDAVVAAALEAADAACALAGLDVRAASSAGVGIPGAISDGVVRHAVNLSVERLDLADRLAEAWGKRPVIENDVNAAAVGAWILSGDGERSIAYLNLGTGLAAGIIIGGKLWRGARGAAGEIGHVSVNPAGGGRGGGGAARGRRGRPPRPRKSSVTPTRTRHARRCALESHRPCASSYSRWTSRRSSLAEGSRGSARR